MADGDEMGKVEKVEVAAMPGRNVHLLQQRVVVQNVEWTLSPLTGRQLDKNRTIRRDVATVGGS